MYSTRNSAFRCTLAGLAGLCAIGLLAACGKPESVEAPSVAAQPTGRPCPIPRTNPIEVLSKNDDELLSASAAGDVRGAQQAIDQGANVNASGALKRTPLFVAAFCDRPELVKLLVEKGGKHDIADANGMLPLHAAVIVGAAETAKILIANGANVDSRDAAGHSALHVAAATNQISMVEMLLQAKANATARDKSGKTAASLARDNGHSTPGTVIRQWQEKQKAPQPQPGRPQQGPIL